MAVQYNYLNLPIKFTFTGNKVIDVLYDGSGRKLRKTVTDNGVLQYKQDYVSGLEYRTTTTVTLSLESIYHSEGRVFNANVGTTSADLLRYEYSIKDYLDNTRLTFTDKNGDGTIQETNTSASEVLQENHYYPFGMSMAGAWMDDAGARDNQYKFNGIEKNEDFGLNLDLAMFRSYDATIGRWGQVDPKPDAAFSPYSFVNGNPFRYTDPLGDTLRGEDARSAARILFLLQNTFNNTDAFGLFSLAEDGVTFNNISGKSFRRAVKSLSKDQRALARGYRKVINLKETVTVQAVFRSEKLSDKSKDILEGSNKYTVETGAQFDVSDGSGRTGHHHIVILMNSISRGIDAINYSDGASRPSSAQEALAHELLGHWLSEREGTISNGSPEAVQASNMYLRSQGRNYFRKDHGGGTIGVDFDPQEIPSYLKDGDAPGTLNDIQDQ